MRGITGDLNTMSLKDLLIYLANRHASGTVAFETKGTRKSITLREGVLVDVAERRAVASVAP
jgi:hypothetical protein